MTSLTASLGYAALAYLVGSIPFAYLVPRLVKGVDIRKVGSGNVGATNVGRVLGFRYFVVVMLLDALKGFLPTFFADRAVGAVSGGWLPETSIAAMAGAILGHNFPIFLGFKGGKGVATSLGSVLALDPTAGLIAGIGFAFVFVVTRVVSVASILGAVCFLGGSFARVPAPFDRAHAARTVVLLLLFLLLVARHRANLGRLWRGTEPRVSFRRRPTGRVGMLVLAGVAAAGIGIAALVGVRGGEPVGPVACGPVEFEELARVSTGHQRAGDLAFNGDGSRLAVACPRYQRLLIYGAAIDGGLTLIRDVKLDGRPVALAWRGESLLALQRPHGDARHVEEGYWDTFDADGRRVGSKVRAGWDPDDLAISRDGRYAIVARSGNAEGEANRPGPELAIFRLGEVVEPVGSLPFDVAGDDPAAVVLSESGGHAAVVLGGTRCVAAVDLRDPARPVLVGRVPLAERELPTISTTDAGDSILMPVGTDREVVEVAAGGRRLLVSTLPEASGLEVVEGHARRQLGRVPLRAAGGWTEVRPVGLAVSPGAGLLAVSSRSGGIHLLAIRWMGGDEVALRGAVDRR